MGNKNKHGNKNKQKFLCVETFDFIFKWHHGQASATCNTESVRHSHTTKADFAFELPAFLCFGS
jgi:hypothetical protein